MKWNPASQLPTPCTALVVIRKSGEECLAVRPAYIHDATGYDLGYEDSSGNKLLDVVFWRYR